jgi:hypothetical protein
MEEGRQMTHKLELVRLLQERTLSNWERRKRRLERIPLAVAAEALIKARKGEPLTEQEYIASHLGFLPGEIPKAAEYLSQWRKKQLSESGGS